MLVFYLLELLSLHVVLLSLKYLILHMEEDGFGSYFIRSLDVAKSATTKLAKYSIALQYLVYEGTTEDEEQSDE